MSNPTAKMISSPKKRTAESPRPGTPPPETRQRLTGYFTAAPAGDGMDEDTPLLKEEAVKERQSLDVNAVYHASTLDDPAPMQDLLAAGLLTVELLNAKNCENKNAIWIIAGKKHWGLLQDLLKANLLTTEALLERDGPGEASSVWLIIANTQWGLLQDLLKAGLLTTEVFLQDMPVILTEEEECSLSSVWLVAKQEQWELLHDLLKAGLLTTKALLNYPIMKEKHEPSVVWLAAKAQQWKLLSEFFRQNILTIELLEQRPTGMSDKSIVDLIVENNLPFLKQPAVIQFLEETDGAQNLIFTTLFKKFNYEYDPKKKENFLLIINDLLSKMNKIEENSLNLLHRVLMQWILAKEKTLFETNPWQTLQYLEQEERFMVLIVQKHETWTGEVAPTTERFKALFKPGFIEYQTALSVVLRYETAQQELVKYLPKDVADLIQSYL